MLEPKDLRGVYAMIPTPAKEGADRWDATNTVDLAEIERVDRLLDHARVLVAPPRQPDVDLSSVARVPDGHDVAALLEPGHELAGRLAGDAERGGDRFLDGHRGGGDLPDRASERGGGAAGNQQGAAGGDEWDGR